jgi:hypothetical protein
LDLDQHGEPLSALFEGVAHVAPTVSWLLLQALLIAVLRDESSHSPCPDGFVYLKFSWMPASFVFSSVWSYQPVAIAVLVYLQFAWGSAPAPLSGRVCCLLASVGSLPLSKLSAGASTPAIFCRLVYLEFACGSAPPHSRTECAAGGSASPPYSGAQGTLLSLVRVLYSGFFVRLFCLFFFCGLGVSLSRGLC